MYSLYIDTHFNSIDLALFKDGVLKDNICKESIQSHSIYVIPLIDELLKNNKLEINSINEVIVVNGPGSFTGVRIGVTIAKTLAYTLNIKIKEISSLLVKSLSIKSDKEKLVYIEDKNGKYVGIFNASNEALAPFIYLNKNEYNDFISINNYEDIEVNEEFETDYQNVYDYSKKIKDISPHQVKPLYVKKIEVQNG